MTDGTSSTAAEGETGDNLLWLHAHEYTPWGAHVAAELEHDPQSVQASQYGLCGARAALMNDHTAVVVGGRAFPVDDVLSTSRLDLFDLHREKWLTTHDIQGSLPRRVGHTVTRVGTDRAVVFGGEQLTTDAKTTLGDCYELTFAQNVLRCTSVGVTTVETGPSARAWHGAASVRYGPASSAALLIMGGHDGHGKLLSDLWVLAYESSGVDDSKTEDVTKWIQLQPTGNSPLPLAYHSVVSVENGTQVVVIGGRQSASPRGGMLESIFVLDLTTNAWSQLPLARPDLLARCCHTAIAMVLPVDQATGQLQQIHTIDNDDHKDDEALRSQILIFGGISQQTPVLSPSRLLVLDKDRASLREIHAPTLGLRSYMGHATVVTSDAKSVFVFGGMNATSSGQLVDATSAIHFWKPSPSSTTSAESETVDTRVRTKTYGNGDVYTGEMDALGEVRQGTGKCVYANGAVYDGDWDKDQRHGQGVMTYADGGTYAGAWQADERHGYGIYEVALPEKPLQTMEKRYEGAWQHDCKHGSGTVTYLNGVQLVAAWEHGVLTQGVASRLERYDDGTNGVGTYTGDVVNGVPHGEGTSVLAKETYKGHWHEGKRSGEGVVTLFDGTTYRGEWKNGKRNGFGICEYARTRDVYDGKWVGGVRCGRGVCRYANGSQYEGDWLDDKCHGMGRYTFPDKTTFYEGHWKDNKFCGDGALVLNLETSPRVDGQ